MIAGSAVFHIFDRDALLDRLRYDNKYLANRYEVIEAATFSKIFDVGASAGLMSTSVFLEGGAAAGDSNFGPISITIDRVLARPVYLDQVPPWDIVITAAKNSLAA